VRTSRRFHQTLLTLALAWGLSLHGAAFGQEVQLILPKDDPIENSEPVSFIAFSPNRKLVATTHGTNLGMLQKPSPGQTVLWDAQTGKRVKAIVALQDGVRSVTFSTDGKTLAVLEGPGIIRLIAVPEGREVHKFQLNDEKRGYYSVAFFPNGEQLAVGIAANIGLPGSEVHVLDIASGKTLRILDGHRASVTSVAVSPDGKLLASGAMDGTARIWDSSSGKSLATLKFPWPKMADLTDKEREEGFDEALFHWVQSVTFSSDGRTLVAAAIGDFEDPKVAGKVGFWEVSTTPPRGSFIDVDPHVQQAVLSPAGKVLMTAGRGSTWLWDAATSKPIKRVWAGSPIAFSPDGTTIAVTVDARTVELRKTPSADRR
jgi:WD40 repeat protein